MAITINDVNTVQVRNAKNGDFDITLGDAPQAEPEDGVVQIQASVIQIRNAKNGDFDLILAKGGGEEVFYSSKGQLYIKDIVIPETVTNSGTYEGCEFLETYNGLGVTSYPIHSLYNCDNLREVYFPKLTKLNTNYFIRQQGSRYNKLETVVIGSVGHPVTEINANKWRYGSHAMVLNITIYVDYSSVADIPTTITQYASGEDANAPTGSVVNVIYRSSTTGEVLS